MISYTSYTVIVNIGLFLVLFLSTFAIIEGIRNGDHIKECMDPALLVGQGIVVIYPVTLFIALALFYFLMPSTEDVDIHIRSHSIYVTFWVCLASFILSIVLSTVRTKEVYLNHIYHITFFVLSAFIHIISLVVGFVIFLLP